VPGRPKPLMAGLALLALIAAACSSSPAGTGSPQASGSSGTEPTITVGIATAPDSLDPVQAASYESRVVLFNMCYALYTPTADNSVAPQLASALPVISNGGKTYTIHLRSGVKFNDGTPFTAAAVKTTLERDITDPVSAESAQLAAVKTIKVINTTTVELDLSQPYAPLTSFLADRAGMIESPTDLKKLGNNFGNDPVCVAPFEFASHPSEDKIVLKKSPYFYGASSVHLGGLIYQVITQPSILATDLQAGSIQVANDLIPTSANQLAGDSSVHLLRSTSLGYDVITINVSNSHGAATPPFTNVGTPIAQHPELRKALELSLSRATINSVVFDGQYVPGCGAISSASPFFPSAPCPGQNIAEAKKLVAQSGVKTPIPLTLLIASGNSEQTQLGTVIAQMASKAGFNIKLLPEDAVTGGTQVLKGKFQLYLNQWSGRVDPDLNITPFWSPDSKINYSGVDDKALNTVVAQAAATTDMAQRKALYNQAQVIMLNDLDYISLFYPKLIMGVRSNVTGVQFFSDGLPRFAAASMAGS
jgi:peptide/nickel transport system substrate-binding protein